MMSFYTFIKENIHLISRQEAFKLNSIWTKKKITNQLIK